jgi:hypothetical protein
MLFKKLDGEVAGWRADRTSGWLSSTFTADNLLAFTLFSGVQASEPSAIDFRSGRLDY